MKSSATCAEILNLRTLDYIWITFGLHLRLSSYSCAYCSEMIPIFDTLLALVGSIFLGLLLRIYPQRNPSEADINRFLTKIGTHDIAHRGGSFNSPENTICAFDAAVKHGFKTLEIDIQYTLDNVPVGMFNLGISEIIDWYHSLNLILQLFTMKLLIEQQMVQVLSVMLVYLT